MIAVPMPDSTVVALVNQLDQRLQEFQQQLHHMRDEARADQMRVREEIQNVADRINRLESEEDVRKGRTKQSEWVVNTITTRLTLCIAAVGVCIAAVDRLL